MTARNTAQRREVIAVLSRVQGFVSAQELHALIVRDGGGTALATVYAQLKRLVADGQVDVVMTDRGESLFRRCVIDAHHHHLACRICGATVEVDAPQLEVWSREIAERNGYRDLRHVLELNGVCPACQSTSN
ncbi:MAG TPA: transcriptional repressor [Acidimicrobiales bacterium]|nr:transcriptional repressor [Acidimicrobiales bacterium]